MEVVIYIILEYPYYLISRGFFEIISYNYAKFITLRDRTFFFRSAYYSTYTYSIVAILIYNCLRILGVLIPTISYSPSLKLFNLAYYYKSYIALKSTYRLRL